MKKTLLSIFLLVFLFSIDDIHGQEEEWSAIELSMDQDFFADFLHDDPVEAYNYTAALRIGIYGEKANHRYLGLPWVRQKVDSWLVDRIVDYSDLRWEKESHNFVFTVNGFSPAFISDQTDLFWDTLAQGYRLEDDLRFASFTGFRSSRRIELSKSIAHYASQFDLAVTTSFTFGVASLGVIRGVENVLGSNRPDGNLWKRDEDKVYPTGQLNHTMAPLFMYSVSVENVLWRPFKRVLLQWRPEVNLGYYTDVGIGLDFGKVMNTDRFIDNLAYTDTHNPGLVSISDKEFAFSLVGGAVVRAVFYNAHVNGMFGWNKGQEYAWGESRRYLIEGYVGMKMQFFHKLEVNFSINTRSPALVDTEAPFATWGTVGLKWLLAAAGEGCYD